MSHWITIFTRIKQSYKMNGVILKIAKIHLTDQNTDNL